MLILFNFIEDQQTFWYIPGWKSDNSCEHGFMQYISLNDLFNLSNGYLQDGKLIILCEVIMNCKIMEADSEI